MFRETFQNAGLVLLGLSTLSAGYADFYFAGNGGNSSVKRTCPGSGFECAPPNVCAYDGKLDKYYCCIPGYQDAVCWGPSDPCDGADSKTPAGNQQGCSSGKNAFCCLKSSEQCTETADQINICWSTSQNPIASLNETAVNDTAHSLESAKPSATLYSVALSALTTLTSTTPGPSSTPTSTPATSTPGTSTPTSSSSSSPSSSPTGDTSSGVSGGAIGGIVGGVVGGLAILGIAGFFLWRRRRNSNANPYEAANSHELPHTNEAPPAEKYRMDASPMTQAPAEMGGHQIAEAPAGRYTAELP